MARSIIGPALWLAVIVPFVSACSSVEFLDRQGTPRLIGLGWVRQVAHREARLYRVSAPGIAFRLYPDASGVSVGFRRTLLFFPPADPGHALTAPVAMQHEISGVDVSSYSVTIGYAREFTVTGALKEGVVQEIDYTARDESRTVVHRREGP